MLLFKNILNTAAVTVVMILSLSSCTNNASNEFYVDPAKGNDANAGSIDQPFRSLDKALQVVGGRVKKGLLSDKIYLRGGVYRKASDKTSYFLELKGTPEDYSMISAMPCDPGTPGCVQRKSGMWYEEVIFDDGQIIDTPWNAVDGHAGVWSTHPGYVPVEWPNRNLWPWRGSLRNRYPFSDHDSTPATTLFTVAPYMLLQDGQPTVWEDSVAALTYAGAHTYDHATGTLYVFPLDNKDPNGASIETWYGGPEIYEPGMLYLDGEGRGMFQGNMEYAGIEGCEFQMFVRLFEFQRRGYHRAEDREIQRYVRIEDNLFEYGWIHFLLDANTIYEADDERIRVNFEDRSHWLLSNNVFYRPSREVFQVHGTGHVFEHNSVIDHIGPWAGPAACVGMLNARNMDSLVVRNNYIVGQGNSRYNGGSVFMLEVAGRDSEHSRNGDYIYKGPTYENNLIADISRGPAFVLGKGDVRMRGITIRNNIIATNRKSAAIQIASPQQNLKIENNIFYDQSQVITVFGKGAPMQNPPLPSTITIRNNVFVDNHSLIDERLFDTPAGSTIAIDHNLFSDEAPGIGTDFLKTHVAFAGPEHFDFTIQSGEAGNIYKQDLGPYNDMTLIKQWKDLFEKAPKALPVNNRE